MSIKNFKNIRVNALKTIIKSEPFCYHYYYTYNLYLYDCLAFDKGITKNLIAITLVIDQTFLIPVIH